MVPWYLCCTAYCRNSPPSTNGVLFRLASSSLGRMEMEILYRDANFVVVNKPPDLKINSNIETEKTVATALYERGVQAATANLTHGYHFVHRLDYATSGVLCIGLTQQAARASLKCFQERSAKKYYLALLRGHVDPSEDKDCAHLLTNVPHKPLCIDIGIGKDSTTDFPHFQTTADQATCKKPSTAITTMYVLQLGLYNGDPATKVLLVPHTGRSHQLRVHTKYIGHTIVGDYTYSMREDTDPSRMMLHAYRLVMPSTVKHIDITAQDPYINDNLWKTTTILATADQIINDIMN